MSVSDFLGAGTPASVEVVATSAANYAEILIVHASAAVEALTEGQVTTGGNQNALGNLLNNATENIQKGKIAQAIDDLNKPLNARTAAPCAAARTATARAGTGSRIAPRRRTFTLLIAAVAALQQ